ncbi:hypothetical protein, partial [Corallococcus sp. CA053C]|uniref:hypothetical protein n=1 Tax=Corallococcus sp. CA053C TaxID=2316732 RepID=UPI0018F6E021
PMSSRLQTFLALFNTAAVVGVLLAFLGHQRTSEQELEALRDQVRQASASATANQGERRAAAEAAMRMWASTHGAQAPTARGPGPSQPKATAPGDDAAQADAPPDELPPTGSFEESRTRVFTAFANEPVDNDWSGKATQTLNETLRQHLPSNSRVKALDCRATLCRVELVHRSAADSAPFMMNGLRAWPGAIFVASEVQEGEDYVVTLIAAKEGTRPPL